MSLCFSLPWCRILPDFNAEIFERVYDIAMGFRFRKSVKIAPGVKINFGKKSVGMSFGGKYGGISFNSKGGSRIRTSIPGTGLSYSTKLSSGKRSTAKKYSVSASDKPTSLRWWYILLIILFALSGIGNLASNTGAAITSIGIAIIMGWFTMNTVRSAKSQGHENKTPTTIKDADLLELQKLLMEDSPEELVLSEGQLRAMADERARNSHRIMTDSASILQTTTNPEVFFDRLRLFETHGRTLVSLEKYVSFSGASPTEIYNTLIKEKQEIIKDFLVRYFSKVLDKADSLKTQKGKSNQYQKFYDSLTPYFSDMDSENINYIEAKYKTYMKLATQNGIKKQGKA